MRNFEKTSLSFSDGLEEAILVDFALQEGRLEALAEYIEKNDCWIHPVIGETILRLLNGTHKDHRLIWGRSKKRNPKQKPLLETVKRDFDLAQKVAKRGGFERAMFADVCHKVGQAQTPKLSGATVQNLVRPFRKHFEA